MDIKTLESWLWEAACSIRGAVDAPKFKDYILPLILGQRDTIPISTTTTPLIDEGTQQC